MMAISILTLPPMGEGAQRADEGLSAPSASKFELALKPSSGLSATFSRGEKGDQIERIKA